MRVLFFRVLLRGMLLGKDRAHKQGATEKESDEMQERFHGFLFQQTGNEFNSGRSNCMRLTCDAATQRSQLCTCF